MNKAVTSKDELLSVGKSLIEQNGLDKFSTRILAKRCGISVGVFYNYFPSKADFLFALVEEFWKNLFYSQINQAENPASFLDYVRYLYNELFNSIQTFEKVFLHNMELLCSKDKARGKQIEQQYFADIKKELLIRLESDSQIRENCWTPEYTKEKFMYLLFVNMMSSLRNGESNCSFLLESIRRILY